MADTLLDAAPLASGTMATRALSPAPTDLEPFRRELTGYCYRMLGSGFEAEDAVQEAMVRAWRNGDRFEGRSSVRSWLYRIATNVCIDMQRQVQRRARPMEMGPASPPEESRLGPLLPEVAWVTPVSDASVWMLVRSSLMRSLSRATKFFQPLAESFETRLSQRGSSSEPW